MVYVMAMAVAISIFPECHSAFVAYLTLLCSAKAATGILKLCQWSQQLRSSSAPPSSSTSPSASPPFPAPHLHLAAAGMEAEQGRMMREVANGLAEMVRHVMRIAHHKLVTIRPSRCSTSAASRAAPSI
jgi:hypothetical protein